MKHAYLALIALLPTIGCASNVSGPESVGESSQATSAGGISASFTMTGSSSPYTVSVTVSNNSDAPANNWNVEMNLGGGTLQQGYNGVAAYAHNGVEIFVPDYNADGMVIAMGSSYSFSFQVNDSSGKPAVAITTVDGVANGTQNLGLTDGIDHLSRAAAMAAYNIGTAYEANKLANSNSDPYYAFYDNLLLSAHAYTLSSDGNSIVFDPNAPGYAYIPNQAQAELAFAQLNADGVTPNATAMYLVTGLMDCFANSSGQYMWDLKAQVFGSGSIPGGWPQNGVLSGGQSWQTFDGSSDSVTSQSVPVGGKGNAEQITYTMTPKTYGNNYDQWFGLLTADTSNFYPAWSALYGGNGNGGKTWAQISKFTGGNGFACTPFNGPGGNANTNAVNPYLVSNLTVNGQTQAVHSRLQQNVGAQCQNSGCTATLTMDPDLYTQSAEAYDSNNNLLGPLSNPFQYDPANAFAVGPAHCNYTGCTQLTAGVPQGYAIESDGVTIGQFSTPVTKFGVTKYAFTLLQ